MSTSPELLGSLVHLDQHRDESPQFSEVVIGCSLCGQGGAITLERTSNLQQRPQARSGQAPEFCRYLSDVLGRHDERPTSRASSDADDACLAEYLNRLSEHCSADTEPERQVSLRGQGVAGLVKAPADGINKHGEHFVRCFPKSDRREGVETAVVRSPPRLRGLGGVRGRGSGCQVRGNAISVGIAHSADGCYRSWRDRPRGPRPARRQNVGGVLTHTMVVFTVPGFTHRCGRVLAKVIASPARSR